MLFRSELQLARSGRTLRIEAGQTIVDAMRAAGYRTAGPHHEIYFGDPRRSAPEKLRTILRQAVALRT